MQFRNINFYIVVFIDILLIAAAHILSYFMRFGWDIGPEEWGYIHSILPPIIVFKILIFNFSNLYRGMWRYTSLNDLLNILKACVITSFCIIGGLLLINRFAGISRIVFMLDGFFTFLFIAGHRLTIRLLWRRSISGFFVSNDFIGGKGYRKKMLIIGAGDAAEMVVREIHDNKALPYKIVGLLDDNSKKIGRSIHGHTVLGAIIDLPEAIKKTSPQEILIAIPSASREQMGRIVSLCQSTGIPYKTLPSLGEFINNRVSIKTIRDVSYRDLLGRPPVRLEIERIENVIGGRVVLVTGAGGSIGSELCRQIIRFKPGLLLLFDASEENLYKIEMEILHEHNFGNYVPILGQVQEKGLLEDIFQTYHPTEIYHAAAYKHVPMVEKNPWEAVFNNILATHILIDLSVQHGVERFILVSTDKAVRPTNVMGASKRITEIITQAYSGKRTRFMAVRFGNVIGSSGSVIPLFRRQIELGGPVTVTDPEITRYFMSIDEAAQLILQAATMGNGGEIFILEMGTPVKIAQMARDLIRLCGKEPDSEIEIKYTGLRPGEKLYEELITEDEGVVETEHDKIMVLRRNGNFTEDLTGSLVRLENLARTRDAKGIKEELKKIVPEYMPSEIESVLSERIR